MRTRIVSLFLLTVCSFPLFAAEEPFVPPTVRITRATGAITVDGNVNDAGWQNATKYETWYETNPGDNIEPKQKTVGWVTYDDRFFYVAMEMWDTNPKSIASNYADHDGINGNIDDYAGPIIDTRNDQKTGYLFLVNARNVQYDAVTDDASGNEDNSPDFFWDSATKITDHGWNVEMRIPFSSLRYTGSNPAQWGLILYRNMPRERRYQMFSNKLPRGGNCFVCRYGKITGLEGLPSGGHIIAAPYVTAGKAGARTGALGTPIHYDAANFDAGLDVKWTPNADTAVDATINPDFSQIESDVAVISANERFAIFFPERRPFFLEGTELFSTPIQAVHTRTINAPRWGLRSTGKFGSNAYTVLVSDDRGGGSVILPSPEGSGFADQDFRSLALISRIRHDLKANSYVSLLLTSREAEGGSHNRVFGPDFQWKSEHQTLTGQLLLSDTQTPRRPDLADEWNGQTLRSHAGYLWYQYSTRGNDFYSEYKDFGDKFRADNGFVPEVGFRSNYTEGGHTFWPKEKFFSRVRVFAMGQYDSKQNGDLLYRLASFGFGADGKYRSFTRLRYALDKVRNGDDVFTRHQLLYQVQFGLKHLLQSVSFNGWFGQDVDFSNNRLGRGGNHSINATIRPTNHLDIALSSGIRFLQVRPITGNPATATEGRLFTSQVERIRAVYTFNSRMFIRTILQNQRTNRNSDLYTFAVNQHSGSLAAQALFAYKLNWQTLMYFGVGDLQEVTNREGDFEPSSRSVFMKISYAFQR